MPERKQEPSAYQLIQDLISRRHRALERLAATNTVLQESEVPHQRYDTHRYPTIVRLAPDTETFQRDIWTAGVYKDVVEIISFKQNRPQVKSVSLNERRHRLVGIVWETERSLKP